MLGAFGRRYLEKRARPSASCGRRLRWTSVGDRRRPETGIASHSMFGHVEPGPTGALVLPPRSDEPRVAPRECPLRDGSAVFRGGLRRIPVVRLASRPAKRALIGHLRLSLPPCSGDDAVGGRIRLAVRPLRRPPCSSEGPAAPRVARSWPRPFPPLVTAPVRRSTCSRSRRC